ncbi:hypothetical protein M378DRAFT_92233 [Amanita muscaria Koide BX008]|uniref:Uncharacterized protein n=1 Tax=Amanita muscaria (strain Koide BX008) TaxID=946122 RepID=A0A0C2W0I9_AMAMK|nr:hypothetical protein M378DRAFT_92233 [Amanita muscaria Koide BX008]
MHLSVLNDPDLLLGLWRGTIKKYEPDNISTWDWAVLKNVKVWKAHGHTVAAAVPFIPASFGRAPRNPAEKINSGYKAWEFQLYIYGLGPTLFRHILPDCYWKNYCKLVAGIRILQRRVITPEKLRDAHNLLLDFIEEFEDLYYRRQESRIHFVRHSVHLLSHIAPETVRAGPLACYAQWTIETLIGNLGSEIRQDRDPYANLAQRAILRAQLNSIQALFPDLKISKRSGALSTPSGNARDFGDGFWLLPRREETPKPLSAQEYQVFMTYWQDQGWPNHDKWPNAVSRWARAQLPNGQRARSIWCETVMRTSSTSPLRRTSCVEITTCNDGRTRIANVQFYFCMRFGENLHPLVMVSLFSNPDQPLLSESSGTVYLCDTLDGISGLRVIPLKSIKTVVSMFPDAQVTAAGDIVITNKFSLLQHPFIELAECGLLEDDEEEREIQLEN